MIQEMTEEWKKVLSDEEFRITRKKGTERPFREIRRYKGRRRISRVAALKYFSAAGKI